jgi:hypothetical protein
MSSDITSGSAMKRCLTDPWGKIPFSDGRPRVKIEIGAKAAQAEVIEVSAKGSVAERAPDADSLA